MNGKKRAISIFVPYLTLERFLEAPGIRIGAYSICCHSLNDLCKNFYFHINFAVVTFLTKIQNWCCKTNKNLSKHNCQNNLDYCPENLNGKNIAYHPRILTNHTKSRKQQIFFFTFFTNTILNFGQECFRQKSQSSLLLTRSNVRNPFNTCFYICSQLRVLSHPLQIR